MKKIGLIGLNKVDNLGDPILFRNTKFLIKKYSQDLEIIEIDLQPDSHALVKSIFSKALTAILLILESLGKTNSNLYYKIYFKRSKLVFGDYYNQVINDLDALIFAGGGMIKFTYENLDSSIRQVVDTAEKRGIPIYFNAVGVEGYDSQNLRCLKLQESLNRDIIYGISTRDYIDILEERYIDNKEIHTVQVGDSALWTNVSYDIEKQKSRKIGLGIARSNIFKDYGYDFNKEEIKMFWKDIVKELERKEIDYVFYTNGNSADNLFLQEILEDDFFKNKNVQYFIPKTDTDLVEFTASCNRILSTRLHASIVAYSLQVPSCGLIWNEKVKSFVEQIGHPNRYFEPSTVDVEKVIFELLNASYDEKDEAIRNKLRNTTKKELYNFLDFVFRNKGKQGGIS